MDTPKLRNPVPSPEQVEMAKKTPEQLCPEQREPESLNGSSDARGFEATVEAMCLDDAPRVSMNIDEPGDNVSGTDTAKPAAHNFAGDKENIGAQRGGSATRSVDLQGMPRPIPPQNPSCVDNMHV